MGLLRSGSTHDKTTVSGCYVKGGDLKEIAAPVLQGSNRPKTRLLQRKSRSSGASTPMNFVTEDLPPQVLRAANLAVLDNIILRFQTPQLDGTVILRRTPMVQHLRLEFRSGHGLIIRGRFFHEDVVCLAPHITRLIEESAEFMAQLCAYRDNGPVTYRVEQPMIIQAVA